MGRRFLKYPASFLLVTLFVNIAAPPAVVEAVTTYSLPSRVISFQEQAFALRATNQLQTWAPHIRSFIDRDGDTLLFGATVFAALVADWRMIIKPLVTRDWHIVFKPFLDQFGYLSNPNEIRYEALQFFQYGLYIFVAMAASYLIWGIGYVVWQFIKVSWPNGSRPSASIIGPERQHELSLSLQHIREFAGEASRGNEEGHRSLDGEMSHLVDIVQWDDLRLIRQYLVIGLGPKYRQSVLTSLRDLAQTNQRAQSLLALLLRDNPILMKGPLEYPHHEPGSFYREALQETARENSQAGPAWMQDLFNHAASVISIDPSMAHLEESRVRLHTETMEAYMWLIWMARESYHAETPEKQLQSLERIRQRLVQDTLVHEWVEFNLQETSLTPAQRHLIAQTVDDHVGLHRRRMKWHQDLDPADRAEAQRLTETFLKINGTETSAQTAISEAMKFHHHEFPLDHILSDSVPARDPLRAQHLRLILQVENRKGNTIAHIAKKAHASKTAILRLLIGQDRDPVIRDALFETLSPLPLVQSPIPKQMSLSAKELRRSLRQLIFRRHVDWTDLEAATQIDRQIIIRFMTQAQVPSSDILEKIHEGIEIIQTTGTQSEQLLLRVQARLNREEVPKIPHLGPGAIQSIQRYRFGKAPPRINVVALETFMQTKGMDFPAQLRLFAPRAGFFVLQRLKAPKNIYIYQGHLHDYKIGFIFYVSENQILLRSVNIHPLAPKGIATAIATWLLKLAVAKFPDNPYPFEIESISNPQILRVAMRLFKPKSLQIRQYYSDAWEPLETTDLYQRFGPLTISRSELDIEQEYVSNKIVIVKQGSTYQVIRKPPETNVTMQDFLIRVKDRATGQLLDNVFFATTFNLRGHPAWVEKEIRIPSPPLQAEIRGPRPASRLTLRAL